MSEKSLTEIDLGALTAGKTYFPSPAHWEDEVIYFALLDRFSDGNETGYRDNAGALVPCGTTPVYTPAANGNAVTTPEAARAWRDAGATFVGGTLDGARTKLGYLQRLGVTALWISPIFKQVPADGSYHGYGIQNFLDVDPHFGTRDDLCRLVREAHALGMRVILDVIVNHSGDVFRYHQSDPVWTGGEYPVLAFRDASGAPTLPFGRVELAQHPNAFPDGAIWPAEFQAPEVFTRKGRIAHWDDYPEFADGDFFGLKDLHHGERSFENGADVIEQYHCSQTFRHLCDAYKFWIALADIDGFRLDTVKHMDPGATRFFASTIHEFAESIGKDNFYIIGEITGGRNFACERMEVTGLNAALAISDERVHMVNFVKGEVSPRAYFDLFKNSRLVQKGSHTWFKDRVVTSFDDHDHVDQGNYKHRFAALGAHALMLPIFGVNATTLGIPCIYYGSEQAFDGEGGSDRYIREAMFGGEFGPFRSRGHHCFDESNPIYRAAAEIHALRKRYITLRRGRQYLRQISSDGEIFGFPERIGSDRMRSIVAWSRLFDVEEIVCAINTDPDNPRTAFVTIEDSLHEEGDALTCLYSTEPAERGQTVKVVALNGKTLPLTVGAAGFVVYG